VFEIVLLLVLGRLDASIYEGLQGGLSENKAPAQAHRFDLLVTSPPSKRERGYGQFRGSLL